MAAPYTGQSLSESCISAKWMHLQFESPQRDNRSLPHWNTVRHKWWCWSPSLCHSPSRWWGPWSGNTWTCRAAPPPPEPALLPWQPAASSSGCSTDACHVTRSSRWGLHWGTVWLCPELLWYKMLWVNCGHIYLLCLLKQNEMISGCKNILIYPSSFAFDITI